jgi:hypothetical protein
VPICILLLLVFFLLLLLMQAWGYYVQGTYQLHQFTVTTSSSRAQEARSSLNRAQHKPKEHVWAQKTSETLILNPDIL